MMEEQTATSNAQVIAETASTQQIDDASQAQTKSEIVESNTQEISEPPNSKASTQSQSSLEQSAATAPRRKTAPEEPQFVIGVIFFLWIFCTLVFLSITAGYVATH